MVEAMFAIRAADTLADVIKVNSQPVAPEPARPAAPGVLAEIASDGEYGAGCEPASGLRAGLTDRSAKPWRRQEAR